MEHHPGSKTSTLGALRRVPPSHDITTGRSLDAAAASLRSAERSPGGRGDMVPPSGCEDAEDVAAFDAAMAEDGANIPWEQVKADLGWT